eukprot:8216394-Pyramimonas_sp.AAC.1
MTFGDATHDTAQTITALLDDAPRITSNAAITGSPKFGHYVDQSDCSPAMHGRSKHCLSDDGSLSLTPCQWVVLLGCDSRPMACRRQSGKRSPV